MASKKVWWRIQGDPNARSYRERGGKFWRGKEWNAAKLWKEISDALDWEYSSDWWNTRKKIVKRLATLLRSGVVDFDDFFNGVGIDTKKDLNEAKKILDQMDKGLMPPCHPNQRTWDKHLFQKKTHLHHKTPRHQWWPVHALWNLLFTSPKLHEEILDEEYHYWEYHGKKAKERKRQQTEKKREQIQLGKKATKERTKKRWLLWQLFWPIEEEPDW